MLKGKIFQLLILELFDQLKNLSQNSFHEDLRILTNFCRFRNNFYEKVSYAIYLLGTYLRIHLRQIQLDNEGKSKIDT